MSNTLRHPSDSALSSTSGSSPSAIDAFRLAFQSVRPASLLIAMIADAPDPFPAFADPWGETDRTPSR